MQYCKKTFNSPLSKRVRTWGEGGRAFNYGIVFFFGGGGGPHIFVCPKRSDNWARAHSSQVFTLFESGLSTWPRTATFRATFADAETKFWSLQLRNKKWWTCRACTIFGDRVEIPKKKQVLIFKLRLDSK